jgi:hypothetical protein
MREKHGGAENVRFVWFDPHRLLLPAAQII